MNISAKLEIINKSLPLWQLLSCFHLHMILLSLHLRNAVQTVTNDCKEVGNSYSKVSC